MSSNKRLLWCIKTALAALKDVYIWGQNVSVLCQNIIKCVSTSIRGQLWVLAHANLHNFTMIGAAWWVRNTLNQIYNIIYALPIHWVQTQMHLHMLPLCISRLLLALFCTSWPCRLARLCCFDTLYYFICIHITMDSMDSYKWLKTLVVKSGEHPGRFVMIYSLTMAQYSLFNVCVMVSMPFCIQYFDWN